MKPWSTALKMLVLMTLLTGIAYPLLTTALAGVIFLRQATGSQVERDGKLVGSLLLAQKTEDPKYFWPRPSAADHGTVASGASNLSPNSQALKKAVEDRAVSLRKAHALAPDAAVPADLVFASGSGLDPHLSPEAARFQMARVARARKLGAKGREALGALVEASVEGPQWGIFGEARVNVLALNLALEGIK